MPSKDPAKRAAQQRNWKARHPGYAAAHSRKWRADPANRDKARASSAASRERQLAAMKADPEDKRHGTPTGYVYGCRCEKCAPNRLRSSPARKGPIGGWDDPRHGTTNGYNNLKCRCDRCKRAWADSVAQYRKARASSAGQANWR